MRNVAERELPAFFQPSVTIFADPAEMVPMPLEIYDFTYLHFHDCLEIGYCVEGKGICRIEDRQYSFQKGDVEIIFPFQQHLSRNDEKECSQWYWINISLSELLGHIDLAGAQKIEKMIYEEMGLCGIFSPEKYPEIVDLVCKLLQENIHQPSDALYHAELCAFYVWEILICLARHSRNLSKLEIKSNRTILSLTPALDLISDCVRRGTIPTVGTLADSCGMSVSHFRRLFRRSIGLVPKDYITKSFLYKAQQLLITTQKSILEISIESGFQDISGFNRQFLAKTGMTPSAFRKAYGNWV